MIKIVPKADLMADEAFCIGVVEHIEDWQEIVDYALQESGQGKGNYLLFSFDDYHQSCYTSMHAANQDALNYTSEQDDVDYDAKYYRDAFEYRLSVIREKSSIDFSALFDKVTLTNEDIEILTVINSQPLQVCDFPIRVKAVPVTVSSELFAAFPNGYFSSDFNTFENRTLSNHLAEHYGYQLIAIGADLIGFARKAPLDKAQSQNLIEELSKLYTIEDVAQLAQLQIQMEQQNYLFLPYAESLEKYEDLLE